MPAVLLMGLGKSGFLSGFGALATPMLSLVVPVPQAAAIMLPLLLVMDATGLQQLWRERDRVLLRQLLPAGLLGVAVGTLLFGVLSTPRGVRPGGRADAAVPGAAAAVPAARRVRRRCRAGPPSAWPPPRASPASSCMPAARR